MDKAIYLTGANANNLLQAQAIHAHNLANVNTNSFKSSVVQFKTEEVTDQYLKSRFYALAHVTGTDFKNGTFSPTGRKLDIAINGDGWLSVQTPTGEEAYTRIGNLKINAEGLLSNEANFLLLGDGGPINVPEGAEIDFGSDGTISMMTGTGNQMISIVLDRLKLVKPELNNIVKGSDGLIRNKDGNTLEPDSSVNIISGGLESSNVNAVSEITSMISLARQFEINLKMMEVIQENEQLDNKILSLS